jgi:hypothetical protein
MQLIKLTACFVVPIVVAFAVFSPNSNNLGKGLALTSTILFCLAQANEIFTQDDK